MTEVGRTERVPPIVADVNRHQAEHDRQVVEPARKVEAAGKILPDAVFEESGRHVDLVVQQVQQQVERAVLSLNNYARSMQRDLEFSIDSALGQPVVLVIDRSTQEVIRQIPNEVSLSLARNLQANLEQLDMQRAARRAGVEQFVSAQAGPGLLNTVV